MSNGHFFGDRSVGQTARPARSMRAECPVSAGRVIEGEARARVPSGV